MRVESNKIIKALKLLKHEGLTNAHKDLIIFTEKGTGCIYAVGIDIFPKYRSFSIPANLACPLENSEIPVQTTDIS